MELNLSFRKNPLYTFVAVVITLWGLHAARELFVPVFLSALLAFLMAPVMRALHKLKVPEWACVIISAVLLILPLAGCVYLVISQLQALVQNWPQLSASLLASLNHFRQSGLAARLHITELLNPALLQSKIENHFGSGLKLALSSVENILAAGTFLFLVIFFAVGMLASKQHLKRSFEYILSSYTSLEAQGTVRSMAKMMESFLVARTVIATGLGVVSFAILLGFEFPYSVLLAALLAVMTWVPVIGFVVAIIPVFIVGLAAEKGPGTLLMVSIALCAVWLLQDHVITPKWVGHKLRLNFLATYLAFFAGGLLWGGWGMVLSGVIRIACNASARLQPWAFVLGEEDTQEAVPNRLNRSSETPKAA